MVLGRVEAHHAHRLLSTGCGVPAPTPELRLQLLHLHRQSLSSSRRRSAASAAASIAAATAGSSAAALARSACSALASSIIVLASATSAASGALRSPCFSAAIRRRLRHRAQYTVSVERVKGSEYKAVQRGDTRVNGTRENRHGIQLVVVFSGEVGSFDFQTLLVNLAGGAGLLAVGAVIVDFIALYVAPGELACAAFHP